MFESLPTADLNPLAALSRWRRRQPDEIAVTDGTHALTYRQLASHVDDLGGRLRGAGVDPSHCVAIDSGHRTVTVVSLLAVWSCGATAVPMDPQHPDERRAFVLADTGADVLLGVGTAQDGASPSLRRLKPLEPTVTCRPPSTSGTGITVRPLDCAYVIYTSGTTGSPKGVEVTWQGLQTITHALSTLGLPPGGTALNAVSPAFDGWLWCSLLALVSGQGIGLVDLTRDGLAGDGDPRTRLRAMRTVSMTPTMLAAYRDDLVGAEVVIAAGEPLPPALVTDLASRHRVLNVYGPTEAAIAATCADSAAGHDLGTIGVALPGYRLAVLRADRQRVGVGETGELWIGGPGVSSGYRNLPALTAQRFLTDEDDGTTRWYRTGDLVSTRPDGCLQFHGRVDDQVKIRGHRVEPAEVERVALQDADVLAAACIADQVVGVLDLAVVTRDGSSTSSAAPVVERVRRRCAASLPSAYRPRDVVAVPHLPALPTGKVDRDAAAVALSAARTTPPAGGPRDPLSDSRLADILETWGEHLGTPVFEPQLNFFEAGGHSLAAARLVASLRRFSGTDLSMAQFLADPTPHAVSKAIETLLSDKDVTR